MVEMRELSYTQAIAEALVQAMEKDDKVFLMGEGVDNITGVYGTVLPAYKQFGEKRVIDTPLSENALTGIAIGAAMDGLRPVLFHQRNDFMLLTMDQLMNHAAKICYMSGGRHRVPLTIVSFIARKPGEGGQHTQSLQSVFAHFPGLKVVMPANCMDAKGLLIEAIADDDPIIVLYHRSLFELKEPVSQDFFGVPIGPAYLARMGTDITIVAVSAAVQNAMEAFERLLEVDIVAEVIDLRTIRPYDREMIRRSVTKTRRLLVVDTGWRSFGVSAEIIACVCEELGTVLKVPPRRIGMVETPAPATPYLLKNYHPDTEQVITAVKEMVK